MVKQIFVNLPVKDLERTMEFWKGLGFEFNMQFTNENAAALVLGENIFAMLLKEDFFRTFTNKTIADSSSSIEVINAIGLESRELVDKLIEKAVELGGRETRPAQDYGWMYSRSFEDVDGHLWEPLWMDLSKMSD